MHPVPVFFSVATLVGCLIFGSVLLRLRSKASQTTPTEGHLCRLQHASRISAVTLAVSLTGLAFVGLAVRLP